MGAEPDSLYEACVGYTVADKTKANSWDTICREVWRLQHMGSGYAELRQVFKGAEENVKRDYGITEVSSAWRSAKSVALNAVKKGVPLVHMVEGVPIVRGKTAVEAGLRGDSLTTPFYRALSDIHRARRNINRAVLSDAEKIALRDRIDGLNFQARNLGI